MVESDVYIVPICLKKLAVKFVKKALCGHLTFESENNGGIGDHRD